MEGKVMKNFLIAVLFFEVGLGNVYASDFQNELWKKALKLEVKPELFAVPGFEKPKFRELTSEESHWTEAQKKYGKV